MRLAAIGGSSESATWVERSKIHSHEIDRSCAAGRSILRYRECCLCVRVDDAIALSGVACAEQSIRGGGGDRYPVRLRGMHEPGYRAHAKLSCCIVLTHAVHGQASAHTRHGLASNSLEPAYLHDEASNLYFEQPAETGTCRLDHPQNRGHPGPSLVIHPPAYCIRGPHAAVACTMPLPARRSYGCAIRRHVARLVTLPEKEISVTSAWQNNNGNPVGAKILYFFPAPFVF